MFRFDLLNLRSKDWDGKVPSAPGKVGSKVTPKKLYEVIGIIEGQ